MHNTLRQLTNIKGNLEKLKRENKGVYLIVDKGGNLRMELDADSKLSENEMSALAQRVQIADRAYNTQLEKYRELEMKDIKENESMFSSTFKQNVDSISKNYDKLFTQEE